MFLDDHTPFYIGTAIEGQFILFDDDIDAGDEPGDPLWGGGPWPWQIVGIFDNLTAAKVAYLLHRAANT